MIIEFDKTQILEFWEEIVTAIRKDEKLHCLYPQIKIIAQVIKNATKKDN